jgi:hypothetical protein
MDIEKEILECILSKFSYPIQNFADVESLRLPFPYVFM